ncbi:MAG: 2-succinyl-5-enolpyruvyl-6-hydroxy-3-cyclohexene-1-carboxylic-acid synthase [Saprospiraceae bacterium]|nr:2-succinyl-5-enolpyruvyl-6-hydroxy-3-cyclohexene-1-carboxylic-acid synthase [Saprospiraceae bacterium]
MASINTTEHLVNICALKGIETVIISPGSRNAPLIVGFNQHPKIKCLSIQDERSAAFFALGMAQQSGKTVALVCTSGTAALNYSPAIAEAYYQKIPLLILTTDRPQEWVDQADGQTIRQNNIYNNYIKKSFQLPVKIDSEDDSWYVSRIISEAINITQYANKGPVHINIPFREPLYNGKIDISNDYKLIDIIPSQPTLAKKDLVKLVSAWHKFKSKIVLVGMMDKDSELNAILEKLSKDFSVVVLSETTSNINSDEFFPCIDKLLASISKDEEKDFSPKLLVTIGGAIVSKKIKAFFRNHKAKEHWHISEVDLHIDTYKSLTRNVCVDAKYFFNSIIDNIQADDKEFKAKYIAKKIHIENKHNEFLDKAPFSDLKVFDTVLEAIPENSNLHLANSTPVRYSQLFIPKKKLIFNSNRGTSGIDGCVSTAAGAAYENKIPTTIITGDIGFLYDSNSLWNNHIYPLLRIIVINNSGGGIFRVIEGPDKTNELEEFFETKHNLNFENIAKTFDLSYYFCDDLKSLQNQITEFYDLSKNKAAILEIKTPRLENAKVLKDYFRSLMMK